MFSWFQLTSLPNYSSETNSPDTSLSLLLLQVNKKNKNSWHKHGPELLPVFMLSRGCQLQLQRAWAWAWLCAIPVGRMLHLLTGLCPQSLCCLIAQQVALKDGDVCLTYSKIVVERRHNPPHRLLTRPSSLLKSKNPFSAQHTATTLGMEHVAWEEVVSSLTGIYERSSQM